MTTEVQLLPRAADAAYRRPWLVDGIRFDWVFIALCCWVIVGMAMDAWAHSHGRTDETFFTPWHAGLYSDFIAAVMFISVTLVVNWQRGYRGWELLPPGYALTMVGLLLFGLGGIGDMIWHELFGIEEDLEAIVSPTHLSLAIALGLTVTGPIRAAWQRAERTPASPFPLLLALSFTWSAFSFLTVYAHPFVFLHALRGAEGAQQLGMAGLLLQSVILSGIVLLTVRRWQMPPGSFLLIYTLNALVLTAISDAYLLVISMMAAGLAVDLMNHFWRPRENRHWRLRLFAFLTPASVYLGYFAVFLITGELAWVIHLWAGGIVLAGIVGWVGSYLIWPPPIPAVADE